MKTRLGLWGLLTVLTLAGARPAEACLWDNDTLAMERERFPSALELITGKFLRHSPAYYEWRVEDRQQKLAALPGDAPLEEVLPLRDDLAVALDKLGRHGEAIETGTETLDLQPGRYESVANLGTFLIHDGQLEKGLELIKEAIRINPDAHFGREKYQQYLVEYILYRRAEGDASLPLARNERSGPSSKISNFTGFISARESGWEPGMPIGKDKSWSGIGPGHREEALKGVLGMMRFGNFNSPILLEAVGELLQASRSGILAVRAFKRAAELNPDDPARAEAIFFPHRMIVMGVQESRYDGIVASLAGEMDEAQAYYEQIVADEKKWIEQGIDVDAAYAAKYYQDPSLSVSWSEWIGSPIRWFFGGDSFLDIWKVFAAACFGIAVIGWLRRSGKRRREQMLTQSSPPGRISHPVEARKDETALRR